MNFDTAFDRLIGSEGGYTNDPADAGGETNWGISKRAYPDLNIEALTREDSKVIYKRDFWLAIDGDKMPAAVAFQTFDFAVNSGISTAIRYLQRAVDVADDGHWGPKSREALAKMDEPDIIMRLNALRLDYMTRLYGWPTFGRGWARRISTNLLYGAEDTP